MFHAFLTFKTNKMDIQQNEYENAPFLVRHKNGGFSVMGDTDGDYRVAFESTAHDACAVAYKEHDRLLFLNRKQTGEYVSYIEIETTDARLLDLERVQINNVNENTVLYVSFIDDNLPF